jgi:hypothetical protein
MQPMCTPMLAKFYSCKKGVLQHVIKTLRREIAAVAPAPKVAPHRKWVETLIGFDASDCPKSMAGAGQLPLLVSPTISNVKM